MSKQGEIREGIKERLYASGCQALFNFVWLVVSTGLTFRAPGWFKKGTWYPLIITPLTLA